MQYSQDYDEKYPSTVNNAMGASDSRNYWGNQIQPYVKSVQIFKCPSSPFRRWDQFQFVTDTVDVTRDFGYRYAMNSRFSSSAAGIPWPQDANHIHPLSQAVIAYPAEMMLVGDSGDARDVYATGLASGTAHVFNNGEMNSTPENGGSGSIRHLEGSNFLHVDGHVKWQNKNFYMPYVDTTTMRRFWNYWE